MGDDRFLADFIPVGYWHRRCATFGDLSGKIQKTHCWSAAWWFKSFGTECILPCFSTRGELPFEIRSNRGVKVSPLLHRAFPRRRWELRKREGGILTSSLNNLLFGTQCSRSYTSKEGVPSVFDLWQLASGVCGDCSTSIPRKDGWVAFCSPSCLTCF